MTSATLSAANISNLEAEPVVRLQQLHSKFVANPTAVTTVNVTRIPTDLGMHLPLTDATTVDVKDTLNVHAPGHRCAKHGSSETYTIAELRDLEFCRRCGHAIAADLPIAAFGEVEEALDVLQQDEPPLSQQQRDAITLLPVFGYGMRRLKENPTSESPLHRASMNRRFRLSAEPLLAQLLNDPARAAALTRWENTHMF